MFTLSNKIIRPFWRMTRGLTLGAQGIVVNEADEVLLVRHGYRPGWHFPGGGVEWNETILDALTRELDEETGVKIERAPQLHGVFTNFTAFPGDHIAVFVVRDWQQERVPAPNAEIREQRFVAISELPDETVAGARNRLAELFKGQTPSATWV